MAEFPLGTIAMFFSVVEGSMALPAALATGTPKRCRPSARFCAACFAGVVTPDTGSTLAAGYRAAR
jgi:hypothetical protein